MTALQAFEAAARHLSFTKAAEELNLTQAAISHRIKTLEERFRVKLFRRLNRRLELTDAARTYLPALREALDTIGAATDRISHQEVVAPIRLTVFLSFATKWLQPRLMRFSEHHPEIDVRVTADDRLMNLNREGIDVGIRLGHGRYPGHRVEMLMTDEIAPVCSPALLEGSHPLRRPSDLKKHTLLHDMAWFEEERSDWSDWLEIAGVGDLDATSGPGFNLWSMLIDAAVAGEGVALARMALARNDLRSGNLIAPFGPVLQSNSSYWLLSRPEHANEPNVRRFREWLLSEAARDCEDLEQNHS
jgi:LysR family glycine cleavage system transcriptional activator